MGSVASERDRRVDVGPSAGPRIGSLRVAVISAKARTVVVKFGPFRAGFSRPNS
jgi:hypothetical protein